MDIEVVNKIKVIPIFEVDEGDDVVASAIIAHVIVENNFKHIGISWIEHKKFSASMIFVVCAPPESEMRRIDNPTVKVSKISS